MSKLIAAAQKVQLYVVNLLLKYKKVDPADDSNAAIRWAVGNGHLDVFNILWHFDSIRDYFERYNNEI